MITKLKSIVFKVDDWVGALGNICIVFNMAFVVINVVMRLILRKPIIGFTDITGFISCLIVVLTVAYTDKENGHINVDFIVTKFPIGLQKIIFVLTSTINMVTVIFLAVCFWKYAGTAKAAGTVTMSAHLLYWPFLIVCGIGMSLFALTIIVKTVYRLKYWDGEEAGQ
jgi:TRAP-type C4-dicarboxylate transport system permease small subunit